MKRLIGLLCVMFVLISTVGCSTEPQGDIDLTAYLGRDAYTELETIVRDPESYVGRKLKLCGEYMTSESQVTGELMHLCVITNEDNGYRTYIEFQLAQGAEYPKENTTIIVSGYLQTVTRLNTTYAIMLGATIQ